MQYRKGWLPSAKLKWTFTFLGKDFAIFNTLTWENPYQEKWKLVLCSLALGSQPFTNFSDCENIALFTHSHSHFLWLWERCSAEDNPTNRALTSMFSMLCPACSLPFLKWEKLKNHEFNCWKLQHYKDLQIFLYHDELDIVQLCETQKGQIVSKNGWVVIGFCDNGGSVCVSRQWVSGRQWGFRKYLVYIQSGLKGPTTQKIQRV